MYKNTFCCYKVISTTDITFDRHRYNECINKIGSGKHIINRHIDILNEDEDNNDDDDDDDNIFFII